MPPTTYTNSTSNQSKAWKTTTNKNNSFWKQTFSSSLVDLYNLPTTQSPFNNEVNPIRTPLQPPDNNSNNNNNSLWPSDTNSYHYLQQPHPQSQQPLLWTKTTTKQGPLPFFSSTLFVNRWLDDSVPSWLNSCLKLALFCNCCFIITKSIHYD